MGARRMSSFHLLMASSCYRSRDMATLVSPLADPGAAEGELRLVSRQQRDSATSGALQVFCDGAWGAVCNANFGNNDALVACRQLGFTTGVPIGRVLADYPPDAVRATLCIQS